MTRTSHDAVLSRVRAEYLEMPGMSLRLEQLARLCGMDLKTCKEVVDALIDARFLCARPDGRYIRFTGDTASRRRLAKARLDEWPAMVRHERPRKAS